MSYREAPTDVEQFALVEERDSLEIDTAEVIDDIVDGIAGYTRDPEDVRRQIPVEETKAAIGTVIQAVRKDIPLEYWEVVELTNTSKVVFLSCRDSSVWIDPIEDELPGSDDIPERLAAEIFHRTADAIVDDQLSTYDKRELDGRGEFALKLNVDHDTYGRYLADMTHLSDREAQVEARLQADLSDQEIAEDLGTKTSTVSTFKHRIKRKAANAQHTIELVNR